MDSLVTRENENKISLDDASGLSVPPQRLIRRWRGIGQPSRRRSHPAAAARAAASRRPLVYSASRMPLDMARSRATQAKRHRDVMRTLRRHAALVAVRSCRWTGLFRRALLVHASRPIELLVRKASRLTVCASRRCRYRPAGTAGPQIKQPKAAPRPRARSWAAAVRAGVCPRMRLPTRRAHPCRQGCVRRRSSGRCGRG